MAKKIFQSEPVITVDTTQPEPPPEPVEQPEMFDHETIPPIGDTAEPAALVVEEPVRFTEPEQAIADGPRTIRLPRAYQERHGQSIRRIEAGDYLDTDPRLFGRASYLLASGQAVAVDQGNAE